VFIEIKLKIGDLEERLNAIAQVIAESDGESLFLYPMWYVILSNPHSVRLEQHNEGF